MIEKDGGPAFPTVDANCVAHEGIAIRDYFAAKVLQAIITVTKEDTSAAKAIAHISYQYADAMLAERSK